MLSSCGLTRVQLLKRYGGAARVDILDRLPTPFGLVRSGVAPDHPDTKARWGTRSPLLLHELSPCAGGGLAWPPGTRAQRPCLRRLAVGGAVPRTSRY
jgi:hypothetical protein